jgi:hypothetical protein
MVCSDCALEAEAQMQDARNLIQNIQNNPGWIPSCNTLTAMDPQYTALQRQLDAIVRQAESLRRDLEGLRTGRTWQQTTDE